MLNPEQLQQYENRIINFVRGNQGFPIEAASRQLSIPLNILQYVVHGLRQKGLLDPKSTYLKIGHRVG